MHGQQNIKNTWTYFTKMTIFLRKIKLNFIQEIFINPLFNSAYLYAIWVKNWEGGDFFETVPERKLFLYISDQTCIDITKSQK